MLYYLVTRRHAYTVRRWFGRFADELGGPVRILPYERVRGALAPGVFVFSDLDRLTPRLAARASARSPRAARSSTTRGGFCADTTCTGRSCRGSGRFAPVTRCPGICACRSSCAPRTTTPGP